VLFVLVDKVGGRGRKPAVPAGKGA